MGSHTQAAGSINIKPENWTQTLPRWKATGQIEKRKEIEKGEEKEKKKKSIFEKDPDDGPVEGVLRGGTKTRDARINLPNSDVRG